MTTNVPAGTAQIFQFPPRGRFALNARDGSNKASFQMTPAVRIASGSAWYHDAAIEDAERSRN